MQTAQLKLVKVLGADGNSLVIRFNGKLSLETVHKFIQSLRPEAAARLILDMSDVSFLDSAGVRVMAQLFVHRRSAGPGFALAGLTKQADAVIHVAGLAKLLPIHTSVEAALVQSG
jgi:anti-sigma B factor antagonist